MPIAQSINILIGLLLDTAALTSWVVEGITPLIAADKEQTWAGSKQLTDGIYWLYSLEWRDLILQRDVNE